MAVAWRASAEAYSASANSLTVTKPTNTANDDIMLAFVYCNAPADAITPPSGWEVVRTINTTITGRMTVYYKVASSEGANYVFGFDSTQRVRASIHSFSGGNTSSPINVSSVSGNSASQNVTATSVTTTVDNCLLVFFAGTDNTTAVLYEPPSGMTERFDSGGTSGAASGHEIADVAVASAGATGNKVGQCNYSMTNVGFLVAIAPASTSTPKTIAAVAKATGSIGRGSKRPLSALDKATGTIVRKTNRVIQASDKEYGTVVRKTGKSLLASVKGTGTLTKRELLQRTLSALVKGTASLVRSIKRPVFSQEVETGIISRKITRTILASDKEYGTINRKTGRVLSALVSVFGSVSRSELVRKTIAAFVSGIGTLSRAVKRPVTAQVNETATITRAVKRPIIALVSETGTVNRLTKRVLSALVKATASMSVSVFFIGYHVERKDGDGEWEMLTYTEDGTYDDTDVYDGHTYYYRLREQYADGSFSEYSNTVSVTYVGSGTYSKTLGATVSVVGTMSKDSFRELLANLVSIATMSIKVNRPIAASEEATGSIVRDMHRTISGEVRETGSLFWGNIVKVLSGVVHATGSVVRLVRKTVSGNVVEIGVLTKGYLLFKTITAYVGEVASMVRKTYKVINANEVSTGNLLSRISKTISAFVKVIGWRLRPWSGTQEVIEVIDYPVEIAAIDYPAGLEVIDRLITMEVIILSKVGNTVRLQATFTDIVTGSAADLDGDAVLKLYNGRKIQFFTDTCTRLEEGVYYYDYTIPYTVGFIHYEISGEMSGYPVLNRDTLTKEW